MERLDRNLEELTGELRVVVTGVQVLFAFLLIVPFNTGFTHVGRFEQTVYLITLILAGLAFLALAMCGCLLLVTTKLFGVSAGALTACLGAIPFLFLWFAIPLRRLHILNARRRR